MTEKKNPKEIKLWTGWKTLKIYFEHITLTHTVHDRSS